jgi:hypothetical protein
MTKKEQIEIRKAALQAASRLSEKFNTLFWAKKFEEYLLTGKIEDDD